MPDIPDSVLYRDIDHLNRQVLADRAEERKAKLGSICQAPADIPGDIDDEADDSQKEAAEVAEFNRKLLTLDEAGQLQLLADQRKRDEDELNAILAA